jgi:hypothetical protein
MLVPPLSRYLLLRANNVRAMALLRLSSYKRKSHDTISTDDMPGFAGEGR